jgi:hypothetical protein
MVLDLAKKGTHDLPLKQRDVRETANIGSVPNISDFSDSQHDHSNAAGGGSVTDSTAGNKGVVIVAAGEGIDVNYSSGTATVTGEDASTSNKGVAKFSAGEGMDVSASSGTITYSGEDASTTNKGIASFNSSNFSVASGAVNLEFSAAQVSIGGIDFKAKNPDTDTIHYDEDNGNVVADGDNIVLVGSITLPDSATITEVVVLGSNAGKTWALVRNQLDDTSADAVANGNINTEDTSISGGPVQGDSSYFFIIDDIDTAEKIYGAIVNYTPAVLT